MNYADRIVFLFLEGFLLAKAVEKANLHTRFAFNMSKFFGTNPKYIVAGFIIVTGFLSAWMSNTATAMLMLPIAIVIISQVKDKSNQKKICYLCSSFHSVLCKYWRIGHLLEPLRMRYLHLYHNRQ